MSIFSEFLRMDTRMLLLNATEMQFKGFGADEIARVIVNKKAAIAWGFANDIDEIEGSQ